MAADDGEFPQLAPDEQVMLGRIVSDMRDTELDFYRDLIDRVSEDEYPSPTMLDFIEASIPPEMYTEYVHMLLEKLEETQYPSLPMLRRIQRLVTLRF